MRLIDADNLIPMIKYATIDSEVGIYPIKIGFDAIKKVVDESPTIEAEPVRHGKWIKMSDADGHYYACSECGEELYREWSFDREYDLFPKKKTIDKTHYCPNCGAKMIPTIPKEIIDAVLGEDEV